MQDIKRDIIKILSNQEFRVYQLLKLNYPNKKIQQFLKLSKQELNSTLKKIYKKLNVSSKIEIFNKRYEIKNRRLKNTEKNNKKDIKRCINIPQVMRYRFLVECGFNCKTAKNNMSSNKFDIILNKNNIKFKKYKYHYKKIY